MQRREFLKHIALSTAFLSAGGLWTYCRSPQSLPNIVLILADDLGYGDVKALNPDSRIPTPNLDALAAQGMVFTDAHSNSAVCTPTRYGLLTGRYAWRSRLQSGVLAGYAPHLIEPRRLTVARLLKEQGYRTACVGKWHLGLDWATKDGYQYDDRWDADERHVDFSGEIKNGPVDLGFDYFFGIASSLDIPPYVYLENRRVVNPKIVRIEGQNGYGFYRPGPASEDFDHRQVLSTLTQKCVQFIEQTHQHSKPFFLYYAMTAPHTPILPTSAFQGKSGIGPYGDFVMEVDAAVGQLVKALKRLNLFENTLIIFTSDNGPSPMANFQHLAKVGHHPSYIFRGAKADIFEGGHRIPFIATWPQRVPAGHTYAHPICLTDVMATLAELVLFPLPDQAGEDSVSLLPVLLGQHNQPVREALVHHSINGSFSIRKGKWKLELCPGSGGWSDPRPQKAFALGLPLLQLYDLEKDITERKNLQDQYPEVVHELLCLLEKYVAEGRSTPGKVQKNDVQPDIWKYLKKRQEP